ncbi:hypothetical protein scyTo_0023228, partial [Scyliorhinus torazame]|nr:hypothetical protein [Scyliorhinus torazame]
ISSLYLTKRGKVTTGAFEQFFGNCQDPGYLIGHEESETQGAVNKLQEESQKIFLPEIRGYAESIHPQEQVQIVTRMDSNCRKVN